MELPRAQYSQEFREQSVKFFKESGLTLVEAEILCKFACCLNRWTPF